MAEQAELHRCCERRCANCPNRPPDAESSKFLVSFDPAMILETDINLTASGMITAACKKRLAARAPVANAWDARLGVRATPEAARKKAR